jgi:hypothetical protein
MGLVFYLWNDNTMQQNSKKRIPKETSTNESRIRLRLIFRNNPPESISWK